MKPGDSQHLPKFQELLNEHKPLNYLNYTNEGYNILTLKDHNDYYKRYQNQIPVYIREQPDWNRSLYKRKNNKVTPYNYILYRNVKNLKNGNFPHNKTKVIPTNELYKPNQPRYGESDKRSITESKRRKSNYMGKTDRRENSVVETLPLIEKKSVHNDKASEISTSSRSAPHSSAASNRPATDKPSGD